MSSRAPIQVPEELKETVEGYKNEFRAKTSYEVIEKLIQSHEKRKDEHNARRQEKAEEAARSEREDIFAGEDVKKSFEAFRKEMRLTSTQALEFLLYAFEEQASISQNAFMFYRKLQAEGRRV